MSRPRIQVTRRLPEAVEARLGENFDVVLNAQGEYLSRFAFRLDRNSDALRPLEGLGVDQFGAVYIVDSVARKVRKIEADGTPGLTFSMETLVGEPADAPWLIQVGPEGQLYAVRQGGQVLRIYSGVGDLLSSNDMYAPVQAMSLLQRPHVLQPA